MSEAQTQIDEISLLYKLLSPTHMLKPDVIPDVIPDFIPDFIPKLVKALKPKFDDANIFDAEELIANAPIDVH